MTTELERLCETAPRVTISAKYGAAPLRPGSGWGDAVPAHNWLVTLRRSGRQITVPFYGGELAEEPSAADVLSCLLLDSSAAEGSFADFCDDMGYDTDSRRAEAIYKACKVTARKLGRFLGDYRTFRTYAEAEH